MKYILRIINPTGKPFSKSGEVPMCCSNSGQIANPWSIKINGWKIYVMSLDWRHWITMSSYNSVFFRSNNRGI